MQRDQTVAQDLEQIIRRLVADEVRVALASTTSADRVPHDRWGMPRRQAAELACRGAIVATKIGRRWYATRADLDAYFAASDAPPVTDEPVMDAVEAALARKRSHRG